ncbi:phenoloxidase-activating factor 2-like [Epargyreus clarus]|uniref:phenoloxidase-activating factor 2-like n=1 Tax=Epargyreus clarus TaxID=520877 RepID=UPI003C2B6A91
MPNWRTIIVKMRLILLLLPILVSSAPDKSVDEATDWLNTQLLDNDDGTVNNRVNLTPTSKGSCTTTDGKEGSCVKPTYCNKTQKPRNTKTLFTYRELGCPHFMLQCCPLDQIRQKKKKTKSLPLECGWTNPGGYSVRSLDEDDGFSQFGDFPWMVALLKRSDATEWNKDDYVGGGSLIHPSVVLTVAHKVEGLQPSSLKCRAGEWDTRTTNEFLPHQDRNVRKITVHEEFLASAAQNDVALLFMETPFVLEDQGHIGVACLARNMPAPGTPCYSMGWGRSFENFDADINSALLKKIKLPYVESAKCQAQLQKTILGTDFTLHNTLMCAGGEAGKDTCVGDGGSSLVCAVKTSGLLTRYLVYGMVAYGVGCGDKDVPGVYAKVPAMLDWVNQKMAEESLSQTNYAY